jgi:integrase
MRRPDQRGLPPHTRERDGYYSWRDPLTGKEYGLGRDRLRAISEAIEANMRIAAQLEQERPRLVDRLSGDGDRTFGAWLTRYDTFLGTLKLAENTRRAYKSLSKRAGELLGREKPIRRITALDLTAAFDAVKAEGKERAAQALRSWLKDCFRQAVADGWIDESPVRATRAVQVEVKRARLTLEVFRQVYASEIPAWLRNAMALGLVTAQRREDISLARFADVRDGGWWVEQTKTKNRVFLPPELRLEAFGMSLDEVVRQCRTTGVLSKHLVHQVQPFGNSPVGSRIWKDTISRRFSDAVEALQLDWGDRAPPTFHEIRSLSERLYAAQGNVSTQELLGHKDPRSTRLYHDSRGAEWVKVRVG